MSDSQCRSSRHLIDIVDPRWRSEALPFEDIAVPHAELPDPEPDSNGQPTETLSEQEKKWSDLALQLLNQHITSSTSN
ncbi:ANAPC13 [Bugula neritina]|uniref:Anaphase-promoting complex subunit 13 n=1 Tax=Bugula neritina TaxID=10212 RepID=A0A7J7JCA4_BUGNE|nr:ANAPC13 [Bugula neritina]